MKGKTTVFNRVSAVYLILEREADGFTTTGLQRGNGRPFHALAGESAFRSAVATFRGAEYHETKPE